MSLERIMDISNYCPVFKESALLCAEGKLTIKAKVNATLSLNLIKIITKTAQPRYAQLLGLVRIMENTSSHSDLQFWRGNVI